MTYYSRLHAYTPFFYSIHGGDFMVFELNRKTEHSIPDEQIDALAMSFYYAILEYFQTEKGQFSAIIVWKLDRFARNRYDSAHYKAALRKNGVKVVSATEVISEGAEGIILESVLEGYAEYYSAELPEKVIRGMTENALKCQYNVALFPLASR